MVNDTGKETNVLVFGELLESREILFICAFSASTTVLDMYDTDMFSLAKQMP